MWREGTFVALWAELEADANLPKDSRVRKKRLIVALSSRLEEIVSTDKRYPDVPLAGLPRRKVHLDVAYNDRKIYGLCPAYSEKTICCGLYTLDAVLGCPFDCSYCTIQTFYGERAELDGGLDEKLSKIAEDLDPGRFRHIGTGQSSDALVWGDAHGMLDSLIGFARDNPQVLLELKTKSDRVAPIVDRDDVPKNVVCSWTLGPQAVIDNEEHGTVSLKARLRAARATADRGLKVAFHLHPIVRYVGWREGYRRLAKDLLTQFSPEEILFFTCGTVTLIRPAIREIRRRGGESKILQMPMTPDHHGKLTYPDASKIEMYSLVYEALSPWHDAVFFYLCMEQRHIWEQSLGFCHATSDRFEEAFGEHFRRALGIDVSGGA